MDHTEWKEYQTRFNEPTDLVHWIASMHWLPNHQSEHMPKWLANVIWHAKKDYGREWLKWDLLAWFHNTFRTSVWREYQEYLTDPGWVSDTSCGPMGFSNWLSE